MPCKDGNTYQDQLYQLYLYVDWLIAEIFYVFNFFENELIAYIRLRCNVHNTTP